MNPLTRFYTQLKKLLATRDPSGTKREELIEDAHDPESVRQAIEYQAREHKRQSQP